jgi:hypothetical protein
MSTIHFPRLAFSSSSGNYTTTTTGSFQTVVSKAFKSSGRPVKVVVIPDGTTNAAHFGSSTSAGGGTTQDIYVQAGLYRDSTNIGLFDFRKRYVTNSSYIPTSSIVAIDVVAPGSYTYALKVAIVSGAATVTLYFTYSMIAVFEI